MRMVRYSVASVSLVLAVASLVAAVMLANV